MKLTVSFYRGVKHAEIDLQKITLIASVGHQGKSSIRNALASLLTSEAVPSWLKKKDIKEIINDASGAALIALESDGGAISINYPAATVSAAGTPLKASRIAAGLESPLDMDDCARAKYFSDLLHTDPTDAELTEAIKDVGLAPEEMSMLLTAVKSGWDAAYERAKSKGAELKGGWKHITGEQYGTKKGETWRPTDLIFDVPDMDALNASLDKLTKERDAIVSVKAVDETERKRLESYVAGYDTAKALVDESQKAVNKLRSDISVKRTFAPAVLSANDQPCPECGKPLSIQSGKIIKGGGTTKEQIAESKKAFDQHATEINELERQLSATQQELAGNQKLLDDCETAKSELAKFATPKAGKKKSRTAEEIDAEIAGIRDKITMIGAYNQARSYHEKIIKNEIIAAALAPEGLRQKKLIEKLNQFNRQLDNVCSLARWKPVTLNDDLSISYGTRHYQLISGSEQFMVRATIQIVCAGLDESQFVIFDGADILDAQGRNGLITVLNSLDIRSVICMTILRRENMPSLDRIGGASYWIENGEVAAEQGTEIDIEEEVARA